AQALVPTPSPPPPPSHSPTPTATHTPTPTPTPTAAHSTLVAAPPPDTPAGPGPLEPSVWATVLLVTVLLPAALAALAGQHFAFSRRSR
ncbi:hypothetical protein, partial [Kitasatospora cineracea]|uniref:hypothetical protein n=1 Tax=Kitasatospora cineracea TaxID=88074 RepID=UPI0037A57C83